MTPEERKLVTELFDRLASLESNPRDPTAVDAINQGLDRAPNAVYSLVQTVLVQDEALKRADARIKELEGGADPAPQNTSFLGNARDQVLGRREETRAGSVPSVRPASSGGISSAWRNTGVPAQPAQYAQPPQGAQAPEPAHGGGGMGGSFLGTAAAAAAGVVGSSLLMGGIRSMMGQSHARSAFDSGSASRDAAPGGGGDGGELSRQAGIDDMGKAPRSQAQSDGNRSGFLDSGSNTDEEQDFASEDVGDEDDFDTNALGGGDEE